MLAYVLACVVGLGSLSIYLAAFFFPEVHRKNDFIWSGLGFFYALVLWVYAERLRGGILLGQIASAALLIGLGWQMLKLRQQLTPSKQHALPDATVQAKIGGITSNLQSRLAKLPIRRTPHIQPQQVAPQLQNAQNLGPTTDSIASKPPSAPPPLGNGVSASNPEVVSRVSSSPASKTSRNIPAKATPTAKTKPDVAKPAPLQAATSLLTHTKNWVQRTFRNKKSNDVSTQPTTQLSTKTAEPGQISSQEVLASSSAQASTQPVSSTPEVAPEDATPPNETAPTSEIIVELAPTDIDVEQDIADTSATIVNLDSASKLGNTAPAVEELTIAELASEVELTPSEPVQSYEPQPAPEATASTSPDSETAHRESQPELIRPNPPDPKLIEVARRNAEAKSDSLSADAQSSETSSEQPPAADSSGST